VLDYGFRVVIAPSFGDIFYNNAAKNGILLVTLPEAQIDDLFRRAEATVGYRLTADLASQTISDWQGLQEHFAIDEFRKQVLLEGLDDIGMTLKRDAEIAMYETSYHPAATLYGAPLDTTPASSN
jgi:3-isopropylmalate/(R)-2-methylmalate dehydratase small subunit